MFKNDSSQRNARYLSSLNLQNLIQLLKPIQFYFGFINLKHGKSWESALTDGHTLKTACEIPDSSQNI